MSTLKQFLLTGRLGDLVCGDDEASVLERLGEADGRSVRTNPTTWLYGDIELSFLRSKSDDKARLKLIQVRLDRGDGLPGWLKVDGWWPSGEETVGEFRDWLAVQGIPIDGTVDSPPETHLVLASGARATFIDNQLTILSWTARRGAARTKQVSISVSRDDHNLLEKFARDSHTSVADLCSRWIGQHLAGLHHAEANGSSR